MLAAMHAKLHEAVMRSRCPPSLQTLGLCFVTGLGVCSALQRVRWQRHMLKRPHESFRSVEEASLSACETFPASSDTASTAGSSRSSSIARIRTERDPSESAPQPCMALCSGSSFSNSLGDSLGEVKDELWAYSEHDVVISRMLQFLHDDTAVTVHGSDGPVVARDVDSLPDAAKSETTVSKCCREDDASCPHTGIVGVCDLQQMASVTEVAGAGATSLKSAAAAEAAPCSARQRICVGSERQPDCSSKPPGSVQLTRAGLRGVFPQAGELGAALMASLTGAEWPYVRLGVRSAQRCHLERPVPCWRSRAYEWRSGLTGALKRKGLLVLLVLILLTTVGLFSLYAQAGSNSNSASGVSMAGQGGRRVAGHVKPSALQPSSIDTRQFLVSNLARKRKLLAKAAAASAWTIASAVLPCAWLILM